MPFTTNGKARLHWQEKGQGTPLLLVMGHRFSSAMWYPAIDALAAKHRVIWFDNRGTGQSATTGGVTIQTMADDAFAVMDAAGVDSAHIYGVSMGGVIVIDMAVRAPARVRSLIVGCSGILSADKPRMPKYLLPLYFLPKNLLLRMRSGGKKGDHGYGSAAPADCVAHDQQVLATDPFTRRGVAAQALAIANHVASKDQVAALDVPSLVLHGDEDGTVPFAYGEELAATLQHGRLVRLAGAGHNYFIARGAEANAEVLGFLDEVDGTGRAA